MQLTDIVPFLVEDELIKLGGDYSKIGDWESYAVEDGLLITGQNPAPSSAAARRPGRPPDHPGNRLRSNHDPRGRAP